MPNIDPIVQSVISLVITAGIKIAMCLIIVLITFPLINKLAKHICASLEKKHADKTINKTLSYVIKIGGKVLVICGILGYFGIDTASVSALIATLGVGVGLAVQGSLANFAGGVLIILTRPFKVDDFIEAQGYAGTVEDIHIIYTTIVTPDGKVISIPNGNLANGTIVNYSTKDIRRVDNVFSISYADDFEKAKKIIMDICSKHELILKDHDIFCRVSNHGANSIDITVRVWVEAANYWAVHFDLLEQVKTKFDEENIVIPFNQLDVHIDK